MHQKHIHIVSFDVPYPAIYVGIIDVYYKLKALHHIDILIQFLCFEYGRHILTNKALLSGTPFHGIYHLAEATNTWISEIKRLSKTVFSEENIKKRKSMLFPNYTNSESAESIKKLIFDLI